MKRNIITAAIILTGCLCAWCYLAAQIPPSPTPSLPENSMNAAIAQPDEAPMPSVALSIENSPAIDIENSPQRATLPSTFAWVMDPATSSITTSPQSELDEIRPYIAPLDVLPNMNNRNRERTLVDESGRFHVVDDSGRIVATGDRLETNPPPHHSLLDIREPSRADFEQCARLATAFLESVGGDQDDQNKVVAAIRELYGTTESPSHSILATASQFAYMKSGSKHISQQELLARKSLGGNIIVLHYHQSTDKWSVFHRFIFEKRFDANGEFSPWRCTQFAFHSNMEQAIATL